jgi:transposase InsO family protein
MVKLIPLKEGETQTGIVISQLCEKIFLNFGIPKIMVADRDPRFESRAWVEFCKNHKIELRLSSVHRLMDRVKE